MATKAEPNNSTTRHKTVAQICKGSGWKDLVVWVIMVAYVLSSPYTKVEESFNLQASHDLLFVKSFGEYDHHFFPGVVPRTFVGPLFLASFLKPFQILFESVRIPVLSDLFSPDPTHDKLPWLLAVRILLGTFTVLAWRSFRCSICSVFGPRVCTAFFVLTCVQFHFLFYASRTLPNTFALILVLYACSYWIRGDLFRAIALIVFAGVVFRSELVLFLAPLVIEQFLRDRLKVFPTFVVGVVLALFSVLVSLSVDSFFWNRPLWPEGEVFFFNAIENKSHQWGVMPWHWYLSNALPKALLISLPLMLVGLLSSWQASSYLLRPAAVFVALYSFLPHKELRFIFYVLPICTAVAAIGLAWLFHKASKAESFLQKAFWKLVFAGVVVGIICSLCLTAGFAWASINNYPGGVGLATLHNIAAERARNGVTTTVHIDVPAAMTGVSRFGQLYSSNWHYSKDEDLSIDELLLRKYDFLLTEKSEPLSDDYQIVASINGFSHISLHPFPPQFVMTPQIFIHQRRSSP